jgi:DNA polymerase-3 subunit gamma/tau
VSFTNGELTYKNTLEHLNILDEDYFFQLYQFLLKQDTGSALLMFDEINRKGFEGDTFIAGFAEFFRNMLVSADPKVVSLLEVADDFKEKYAAAAKQANLSFVISALNVLNESEINYRLSKNKRLHVEMMLIKLCYLQQALQLVENESGLVKKKLNDNPRTVSFKALKIVKATETATPKFQPALSEAKLIVEETLPFITKTTTASTAKEEAPNDSAQSTKPPSPSLGSLQKISQQISSKNSENNTSVPLSEETLTDAWKSFIEFLKTSNNHTAASNFLQAYTIVTSDTSFEIITESEIQRSFIDAERATLIGHMQHWFKNRSLSYKVTIKEKEGEIIPVEVPIGKKQIYQNMIEEYPLIKELKEKLKLDLN